jgi:hypothetical protein
MNPHRTFKFRRRQVLLTTSLLALLLLFALDVHNRIHAAVLRHAALHRPRPAYSHRLPTCEQLAQDTPLEAHLPYVPLRGAVSNSSAFAYLYLPPAPRDHRRYLDEIEDSLQSLVRFTRPASLVVIFTPEGAISRTKVAKLEALLRPTGHVLRIVVLDDSYLTPPISGAPSRLSSSVRCSYQGPGQLPVFSFRYLQMNAFRLFHIFRHPEVQDVDFLVSIDSDTVLQAPFPDVVRDMLAHDYVHAHTTVLVDPSECVPDESAVSWFMQCLDVHPSHAQALQAQALRTVYYGNLQVLRRDFFTSAQYRHLLRFFDGLRGVNSHRWSDQNLFYIALHMFLRGRYSLRFDCQWRHK